MRTSSILAALLLVAALTTTAVAGAPPYLNYQGMLTDDTGDPLDGTYSITFSIYDAAVDGTELWSETNPSVTVTDGLFSVRLGSISPMSDSAFAGSDRWLAIAVGADPEIDPRTQFVTVPYGYRVQTIDGAEGGSISGDVAIDGNLGVGTANDSAALFVDASTPNQAGIYVRATENTPAVFAYHDGTGHGVSIIKDGPDGDALSIIRSDDGRAVEISSNPGGGSEFFVIEGDGRVGIKTTTPTRELEVNGIVRTNGFEMFPGANHGYVLTSDGSGHATWQAGGGLSSGGSGGYVSRFETADSLVNSVIYQSGPTIGIGTTSPMYTLDVLGSFHATNSSLFSGSLGVGAMPGMNIEFNVQGDGWITENLRVEDGAIYVGTDGYMFPGGYKLNVAGSIWTDSDLHVTNNVGIGTTTPAYRLDIAGTGRMTGFRLPTSAGAGLVLTSDASGNGTWQAASGGIGGSGTANYIPKFTSTSDLGLSQIYQSGTNIGIGTLTPTEKLSVYGKVHADEGITTGQGAAGNGVKFGAKDSYAADISPIVTCNSGYIWWDYSAKQLILVETNAGNNYCAWVCGKNEGAGMSWSSGLTNTTRVLATLDANGECAIVDVTSESSTGGHIHLYAIYSNMRLVTHYNFRFQ